MCLKILKPLTVIASTSIQQALVRGQLLENYPQHQRGACCLFGGLSQDSRPLHIVCTTVQPLLIIITVYEPKLPTQMDNSHH